MDPASHLLTAIHVTFLWSMNEEESKSRYKDDSCDDTNVLDLKLA